MIRFKTLTFLAVAAIPVSAAGVAIAGASDAPEGKSPNPAPAVKVAAAKPLDAKVAARFSAFRSASPQTASAEQTLPAQSTLAGVQRSLADPDAGANIRNIDLARAVAVPIEGEPGVHAWIVPSGDRVCTILPDPIDGAGITCSTISQAERGLGVTFLGGAREGDGTVLAATLVPDGNAAPAVKTDEGERTLPAHSNLSVAKLPGEGTYLPDGKTGLADLKAVATPPSAPTP